MYLVYYCRYRCICCVHTSLALRRSPAVAHPPSLTRRRSCWLYAAVVPGTNCCSSNVPGTTFCCCNLPGTFFCVSCVYVRYKNSGGRATAGERASDGSGIKCPANTQPLSSTVTPTLSHVFSIAFSFVSKDGYLYARAKRDLLRARNFKGETFLPTPLLVAHNEIDDSSLVTEQTHGAPHHI